MSKAKLGAGMSFFFGFIANIAPIPNAWRLALTGLAAAGLAICLIGYLRCRNREEKPAEPQVKNVIDQTVTLLGSAPNLHPLQAMRIAGAANLLSNEEVAEVNADISGRGYGSPLNNTAIRKEDFLSFMKFSAKEQLPLGNGVQIYEATKQFYLKPSSNPVSREECFETAARLLKAHRQYMDTFHGLFCSKADQLESNDDLIWVCEELSKYGYDHPFDAIHLYVPKAEWLEFIQWGKRHATYDFERDNDYLSAAQEWGEKHGHPKPSKKLRETFEIHKALKKRIE